MRKLRIGEVFELSGFDASLRPAMTVHITVTADDDADHVRRRQIFLLDLRTRGCAVFRRQQAAFSARIIQQ